MTGLLTKHCTVFVKDAKYSALLYLSSRGIVVSVLIYCSGSFSNRYCNFFFINRTGFFPKCNIFWGQSGAPQKKKKSLGNHVMSLSGIAISIKKKKDKSFSPISEKHFFC